jgi:flagellar basal-body rod modification protein FlgD
MGALSSVLQGAADSVASSLVVPASNAKHSQAAAAATASSSSTASTSTSTTITSNDFLTLLVTEMQNQDPTQPTDPNAYIQQLVGVNSLQELISINQGISAL